MTVIFRKQSALSILCFHFVEILTGVASFIAQTVNQLEETRCQKGAKKRTDEINPKVMWEVVVHCCRTQGPSKIKRSSGEVDAYILSERVSLRIRVKRTAELTKEERQADSNRR